VERNLKNKESAQKKDPEINKSGKKFKEQG